MHGAVTIRPAVDADARALARIHWAGRATIPLPVVHPFIGVIAYHRQLIATASVMVAEEDGAAVGYAARRDDELAQLYVLPGAKRRGVGRALVMAVQSGWPLRLWCFAHNGRARAFYAALGAVEIGRDGGANEEEMDALQLQLPPRN